MLNKIAVDTHTHTVLSGHAWSTLTENANAAASLGMHGICLTEHGPRIPGGAVDYAPAAQMMLPTLISGVTIFRGVEANIVDFAGNIDIEMRFINRTEFALASIHDIVLKPGTPEENTAALVGVLSHPYIDMVGHIDDAKTPNLYEEVILAAKDLGKLIEINNNSLLVRRGSEPNIRQIARLCKKHQARVCVSSDAHFWTMIGNVSPSLMLIDDIGFPDELVVNRSADSFHAYLAERADRLRRTGSIRKKR
ncbi:MAG: phosphatase [Planctomycetota bacterium]|jgi:putative hydrolase|nr:phosphatase [Planctomycetota bacterium]